MEFCLSSNLYNKQTACPYKSNYLNLEDQSRLDMKKYILIMVVAVSVLSGCTTKEYDLEKMGDAVRSHIRYRDADNGTITKIEVLDPVSYDKIPEDKRESPDEVYLCKVYIKGTWTYAGSYRVYNMDDTLRCYFSKSKTFLRMAGQKAEN